MMLDQVLDSNQAGMFQINTVLEFPDFVKEATQTTPEDIKTLDSERFAWPAKRMFPMHTAQDTWLSAAYFHKFGSEIPEHSYIAADESLKEAAQFWDIDLPVAEDLMEMPKEASFGYDIQYPMGKGVMVRVISASELQKVADDVLAGGKYPLVVRQGVAKQALQAPEEFQSGLGMRMVSDLQKVAGMGIGTESAALGAVRQRWHATAHFYKPIKEGLEELSTMIKTASEDGLLSHDMTQKTASMLDAVDRFVGLHNRYNEDFQPPERQLFDVTLADYDQFDKMAVRLTNGEWIHKADLEEAIPFLEESFGQKCASVEEALEVVRAMPERRANILSTHLKNNGASVL